MNNKKSITLIIAIILVIIVAVIVAFLLSGSDNKQNTNNNAENNSTFNNNSSDTQVDLYEKYPDLVWMFDNDNLETLEFNNRKIVIEDGKAYIEENDSRTVINTIDGEAKYVIGWGLDTIEAVYILTEDGSMWKSEAEKGRFNTNFEKLNLDASVVDMTNGDIYLETTIPPYFLLSTGELVNEQGNNYIK